MRDMNSVGTRSFDDQLIAQIHTHRSSEWLPEIPSALASQLLTCERLTPKLAAMMRDHYRLAPLTDAHAEDGYSLATLSQDDTNRLVKACGIVWNGYAFVQAIAKSNLAEIVSFINEKTYRVAMDYVQLSPVIPPSDLSIPSREQLWADGFLCYVAWSQSLNPNLGERVLLKFSPEAMPAELPSLHEKHGARIVREVGQGLFANG